MPHNRPLRFKVASRKDFAVLMLIFLILAVVAALLSPQPILLILLVFLLFGAWWLAYTLGIHKVNDVELVSVIFPDGRLRIESDREFDIEGFLEGQQWCTRHVAVLRYTTGGKYRYLVLLSARQNADEYRRLSVWLRQDFCNDSG